MKKLIAVILLSFSALLITACKPISSEGAPETTCSHVEVVDAGSAATCTEPGLSDGSHCSVCGVTLKEQTVIQPTGHSFGEWKDINTVSCTEGGEQERTCTVCGFSEKQTITASGHSLPDEWTVDVPATCTQTGTKSRTCTRCGEKVETVEIPMTEHVIVTDPAVAATCTKSGLTEGKHCSVCNTVITAQKKTTASHRYSGYKCSVCGKIQNGHQVDYLRNWIIENGKANGEATTYKTEASGGDLWMLGASDEQVVIGLYGANSDITAYVILYLEPSIDGKYGCGVTYESNTTSNEVITGFLIEPKKFTKNTALTLISYNGPEAKRNTFAETSRLILCQLLDVSKTEMKKAGTGLTLADLGFTAYK